MYLPEKYQKHAQKEQITPAQINVFICKLDDKGYGPRANTLFYSIIIISSLLARRRL